MRHNRGLLKEDCLLTLAFFWYRIMFFLFNVHMSLYAWETTQARFIASMIHVNSTLMIGTLVEQMPKHAKRAARYVYTQKKYL